MTEPPVEPVEVDRRRLGPLRRIGSGGQGTVYELVEQNHLVYKQYSPSVVDDVDVDSLVRFVEFERDLPAEDRLLLASRAAWPRYVVRDDGVVRGFVMARAPDDFQVTMAWPSGERSAVLGQVQFLLNDNDYLRARDLGVTAEFRLRFLLDVVTTLDLFHRLGITVGDLSPNNLLFTLTEPRCYFIDCDAMRVGDATILEQVETPDWRVSDLGDEPWPPRRATTTSWACSRSACSPATNTPATQTYCRNGYARWPPARSTATRPGDRPPTTGRIRSRWPCGTWTPNHRPSRNGSGNPSRPADEHGRGSGGSPAPRSSSAWRSSGSSRAPTTTPR